MTEQTFAGNANTDPQATPEAQESAPSTPQPSDQEQVALVVGERAFRTMDDVRTKISHQDEFIEQLKQENLQLRETAESLSKEVKSVESVKDVLSSKETKGLTPEEVDALIDSRLDRTQKEAVYKDNLAKSMEAAKGTYGDEFIATVQKQAEELGLSGEQIDEMAGSNPRLFERTFLQGAKPKPPQSAFNSDVRGSNFNDTPQTSLHDRPIMSMTSKERTAAVIAKLEQANQQSTN